MKFNQQNPTTPFNVVEYDLNTIFYIHYYMNLKNFALTIVYVSDYSLT